MVAVETKGVTTGSTSCYLAAGASAQDQNRDLYVRIWQFFSGTLQDAGYVEIISYNFGASATGMDISGGSTPCGENSFFVAKMLCAASGNVNSVRNDEDLYVMFQWCDTAGPNTDPGNPAEFYSSTSGDGVAYQISWRDDCGIPWMGSQFNNGTDRKGATAGEGPVWGVSGSSNLYEAHVFPVGCEPGGTHATNRQNCLEFRDLSSIGTYNYLDLVADADNILMAITNNDDITNIRVCCFGAYTPTSAVSASFNDGNRHHFYNMSWASADIELSVLKGLFPDYNSATSDEFYASPPANPTGSTRCLAGTEYSAFDTQPNNATGLFELNRLQLGGADATFGCYGLLGHIPIFRTVVDMANNDYSTGSQFVVLGSVTSGERFACIPYSSTVVPKTSTSFSGEELRITGSWPAT